jgi:hypothetical protein
MESDMNQDQQRKMLAYIEDLTLAREDFTRERKAEKEG